MCSENCRKRKKRKDVAEIINANFDTDDLITGGDNLDDVKLIQDNKKLIEKLATMSKH